MKINTFLLLPLMIFAMDTTYTMYSDSDNDEFNEGAMRTEESNCTIL